MAKLSGKLNRQLDGKNPRLTVRLDSIFGKEVSDDALREEIGQAIIDRILLRTQESLFMETGGRGKDGSGPLSYTKGYRSSFSFRVLKGSTRKVNLSATGDMLRAMDIIESEPDKLILGFDNIEDAEKAHGHITGSVGKTRDFFGLPEVDIDRIRKSFQSDVDDLDSIVPSDEQRRPGEGNLEFLIRILSQGEISG